MTILITTTTDPELHEVATELLSHPCVECKRTHVGVMLLMDSETEPFCLCADCGQSAGLPIIEAQQHLLAARAEDQYAERTVFMLELARHWNEGRIPLSRKALFNEPRWAQA